MFKTKINFIDPIKDIRFWIIIFFLIRLYSITNPPLEYSHNWRQTTVTMVARNFLEIDNNIFFPRIDISEDKTGITGMEFPIFNYLIYIFSEFFGYQHWYGRLINLIFSSFGLFFFYKLLRKYFNKPISFYSTIILSVSIWFQFSRKIMPDTFSMSLIIMCLYFGSNFFDKKTLNNHRYNIIQLVYYFIFLLFGVLSKLPSGFILIIFCIFFIDRKILLKKKVLFSIVTLIAIIPSLFWYYKWVPHLVEKYDLWHFFMGYDINRGYKELLGKFDKTSFRFYDTAIKYIGFSLFIIGIILTILNKKWKIFSIFLLSSLTYILVLLKSGGNFAHHNYYVISYVPVMAIIAGYGLSQIKNKKIIYIVLIALVTENLSSRLSLRKNTTTPYDYMIPSSNKGLLSLENDLSKISKPKDLIIINSGKYPTPMYFSHRKGWVNSNEKISDPKYINSLKKRGLKFIVILKRSFGKEIKLSNYKNVLENKDYCIYKI